MNLNLFVESNFVLELAFQREEFGPAQRILELASRREIDLAVPAYALSEPFEALVRRAKQRNETLLRLREQITELGRSAHFSDLKSTSEGFVRWLAQSVETEAAALDNAIGRILDCAHVIPFTAEIVRRAFTARDEFAFERQDSIVFASVERYLNERGIGESIFANRNSKDFATPAVEDHFAALNCKVLSTFADAVGLIQHRAKIR
jgi:predicted nucleic acid-binding protein